MKDLGFERDSRSAHEKQVDRENDAETERMIDLKSKDEYFDNSPFPVPMPTTWKPRPHLAKGAREAYVALGFVMCHRCKEWTNLKEPCCG